MTLNKTSGNEKIRTREQIVSSDPNTSVWVGANAGTGKTGVLVDRILRLLLKGVQPSSILCLTFTKAAAVEMSTRLNAQLAHWSAIDDKALRKSLEALIGANNLDNITLLNAPVLFSKILDSPGGLKINTIHSFCESLLSRFPVEAGIAPHFRVIDERTSSELRSEARNRLMLEVGRDQNPLSYAFSHLAGLIDETSLVRIIEKIDIERTRLDSMLQKYGSLDGMIADLSEKLSLGPKNLAVTKLDNICDQGGLAKLSATLKKGTASDLKRSLIIERWLKNARGGLSDYQSIFITKDGEKKTLGKIITKKLASNYPEVILIIQAEQRRLFANLERAKAEAIVSSTKSLLTIILALYEKYENLKRKKALVDYDDLIKYASKLLSDGGESWVHYKLDGGIEHILLDESQDTSPEQWRVIASLANDFFSGEGAGEKGRSVPRTIFAVGDQKQSIFSFQGADPKYFSKMRSFFERKVKGAKRPWSEVELALSFRSVRRVLQVVDGVFNQPDVRQGVLSGDEKICHISSRIGQAGLVEIWPTFKPKEVIGNDPWDAPVDQLPQKSPLVELAQSIALEIKHWLESGQILDSASRPIRPGDIMILVRTRGQFAEEMVRQLKQASVPVAGSDRMVLLQQMAVMDMIALGEFVLLPSDDLNLAIILKSPFFSFNEDQLFELSYERKGSLWSSLREKRNLNKVYNSTVNYLEELIDESEVSPPYEFFTTILGSKKGREKILSRLGPDASDPIDEFLNLCLEFERDHTPSLTNFLHWIKVGQTQIKRDLDQGQNEVRVMTVHGAKGLQSSIVFLPDTCSVPNAVRNPRLYWEDSLLIWPVIKENEEAVCKVLAEEYQNDALKEYSRLLYVALTRAEERVYICGWENKFGLKKDCWYNTVKSALKRIPDCEQFETESGEYGLRLRDSQCEPPDREIEQSIVRKAEVQLPIWVNQSLLKERFNSKTLKPSKFSKTGSETKSPLLTQHYRPLNRGKLVHKLLETLSLGQPAGRWERGLEYLSYNGTHLKKVEKKEIMHEVLAVLEKKELSPFFGPNSLGEVPLMGYAKIGNKNQLISGTVDRILFCGRDVKILDFKTDKDPALNDHEIPMKYLKQMAAYRAVLRQIYAQGKVEVFLLWTTGPSLMYLEEGLLNDAELDGF